MRKQKRLRRLTALLLAMVLTVGSGLQAFALSGEVTGRKQATVTSGSTNWSFTLEDEDGYEYDATCVEPDNSTIPEIGENVSMSEADRSGRVAKIAYLGSQNGTSDKQMYIISRAAARARGKIGANSYSYIDEVNALYDEAGDMSGSIPDDFTVYIAEPSGGGQTMMAWREVEPGSIALEKISSNPSAGLALDGARYGIYTSRSAVKENDTDKRVDTLDTDEDGEAKVYVMPGTYYIKETKAPDGFALDETIYEVEVKEGETTSITSIEQVLHGKLWLKKTAAEDTDLDLAGAKYGVYTTRSAAEDNDTDYREGILETDEDGRTNVLSLIPDFYYVKETKAPEGFELDDTIYRVEVKHGETTLVTSEEELSKGWVKVKKVPSENTHLVEACPQQYSLAGAEYSIYTSSSLSASTKVATLTTKSDGTSNSAELPIGIYYGKETKRPKGYEIDETVHKIVVKRNETTTFTSEEKPLFDPMTILLAKKDGGGNGEAPSLAGAVFTVKYYRVITDDVTGYEADRTWKFKTNAAGVAGLRDDYKIGGNDLYKDNNGQPVGLIGTYTIQELEAPKGYVRDDKTYYAYVTEDGTTNPYTIYNEPEVPNERKEFRLKLTKKDSETGTEAQGDASLSGAVFGLYRDGKLVKRYTTGSDGTFTTEYHTLGDGSHTYTVKEITPPEGYLKNNTTYTLKGLVEEEITVPHTTVNQTVNNDIVMGSIALTKVYGATDDTGALNPEEGIQFQVYLKSAGSYSKAEASEKQTITTDKYGFAQTKELPYGIYTVHQVNTFDGHDKIDDFDVFISKDGELYRYTLNNGGTRADVRVRKVDSETGKIIPAANTAFKIWDVAAKEWVSFEIKYPNPYILDVFETDASGTFQLPDTLDYGQYELEEQAAPEGYVLSKDRIPFKVDGSTKLITVTAENMPQKGTIEITKTGEVLKSVTANEDGTYTPVYGEGVLSGAVFEITAKADIVTPDGTKRYSAGEKVDTVTTDADSKAVSRELYLGPYDITEITAPENHVLNTAVFTAELTYAGQNVTLTSDSLSIDNERQKAEISLVKSLETDDLYGYSKDRHEDIVFGIFAETEITAKDGTSIPAGGMVETIGVTEDGNSYGGTFTADLPHGKYYVQETAVSEGYILDDTRYPVDFTYKDQNTAVVNIAVNDGHAIDNEIIRGDIEGRKTDENGNALSGALMGLFMPDETVFTEENALQTDTSGLFGSFGFKDVPYGKYIVREIKAPTGFALNQTSYEVTIDKDGVVVEIEIVNEITKFDIAKTDITTGEYVVGAQLSIISLDADGNPDVGATFATWITEEKEYRVEGLEPGKTYVLRERLTGLAWDYGYVTAEDILFTVKDTGEVQKLEMKDDYTKVEISKTDIATGEPVIGAQLTIIPLNEAGIPDIGAAFDTWITEENPHYIERIPVGNYILREKLTGAAWDAGYVTAEDIYFTVKDTGEIQKVEMQDDHTKLQISKVDSVTKTGIPETELTLYPVDADGKVSDTAFSKGTTDKDGNLALSYIPVGKYAVRETGTNFGLGYVTAEDLIIEVKDTPEMQKFTMEDDHTKLQISKVDIDTGKGIPETELTLYAVNKDGKVSEEEAARGTINQKGILELEYLPVGKYAVRETGTNFGLGYVTAEDLIIEVKDTPELQKFTMKDDYTKLEISKTDMATGEPVVGAKLSIIRLDTFGKENKKAYDTWNTEKEPHFIEYIPVGDYILREESAPDGYVKAEDVRFTVKDTGEIQQVKMQDDYTKVEILKLHGESRKPLAGASLQLFDSYGKLVREWTSTEKAERFDRLPAGKYTLKELEAPEGYMKAKPMTLEVKETTEKQTFIMLDEENVIPDQDPKPEPPETGDTNHPIGWIAVALLGIGGLIAGTKRNKL